MAAPAAPTLTAVAEDDQARVLITVTAAGPDPLTVTVERSDDGGVSWGPVIPPAVGWPLADASNGWVVELVDVAAPGVGSCEYRAAVTNAADETSPWTTPVEVTTDIDDWWLVDVATQTAARVPHQWAPVQTTRERDQGRFRVLDRDREVVVSGVMRGAVTAYTGQVRGRSDHDQLIRVVSSGRTLLYRDDAGGMQWVQAGPDIITSLVPSPDRRNPIWEVQVVLVEVDEP